MARILYLCRMKKKTIWDMGRLTPEEFAEARKLPVVVVLDNVRSLNNIGSLFRTADCFAVAGIALCGISQHPPSPEIHKTALGAEDTVAWTHYPTTADAVTHLRAEGFTLVCLEQVFDSTPLDTFRAEPGKKYALVLGNEVDGVDPAIVDSADMWLEIPQSGTKHSLNVTVSAAVALWEFYKQLY